MACLSQAIRVRTTRTQAFGDLKQAKDNGTFYYDDAAVVSRDADGKVTSTNTVT